MMAFTGFMSINWMISPTIWLQTAFRFATAASPGARIAVAIWVIACIATFAGHAASTYITTAT